MKASVFVGTSLDGFIARSDGNLDFLHRFIARSDGNLDFLHQSGGGESHGYNEFFASVDALVIGRNTFDIVLSFDTWPYGNKPVFALSTRPLPPAPAGAVVEQMSGPPEVIASTLAGRGFQHIYVDGGVTIQRFLDAGLIDRIVVTRVPVLIGSGIPLFGPLQRDIALRHVATRQFASGLVQSEYEVGRIT